MLKLIPISEADDSKNIIHITIKELEDFAYMATSLEPVDSFSIIDGYTTALWEYMQEKKHNDKGLFHKYDKLIHAKQGNTILKTAIELFLLEKEMRKNGISNDIINKYESQQREYIYLIDCLEEE